MTTKAEGPHKCQLSVVIPARNAEAVLPGQLSALSRQTWAGSWEVVVADNGSTDRTRQAALCFASQLPRLRVVDAGDRPGRGRARNVGAGIARGDLLVFLDADDEAATGYLDAMARSFGTHDLIAARMDYRRLNDSAAVAGRPVAQADGVGAPFGFLPGSGAGGLGIRRSLFERVGGFSEALTAGEDIELCWRAQLAGSELAFVPEAVVHVRLRSGVRDVYRQGCAYGLAGPGLYRSYRSRGMPRRSPRTAAKFWFGLLPRVAAVRSKPDLETVAFLAGVRTGLLVGCARHRVLYL